LLTLKAGLRREGKRKAGPWETGRGAQVHCDFMIQFIF